MFTETDLKDLLSFVSPAPVLSVYLNTEPLEGNIEGAKLRLKNMLRKVNLPEDVEEVERFFNHEYDWTGKGAAVFSSAPQKYWRSYTLAAPIRNWIYVADRPSVKPLADLFDNYGGYGVALVDKQGARFFSFHLGELREQEGVVGEQIKHTKRGGASSVPGRRGGTAGLAHNPEELVERNMKEAAEFAAHFFEENHVRRVLIGGTEDNVSMFRGLLPKAWQSLVKGSFAMSMTASHADVLEKAMQIGMEAERARELSLIENVVTLTAKKSGGVLGLEQTLDMMNEGRIRTLVTLDGYHQAIFRCGGCGSFSVTASETCHKCGGKVDRIPDGVDLAIAEVMRKGGDVEMIHENSHLEKAGKIGALLRY